MNKLNNARRAQVIRALVEGNSIRATVRMTGVAKNTIAKLLVDVGEACAKHHSRAVVQVASGGFSVTRYGAFAMPNKRTSR